MSLAGSLGLGVDDDVGDVRPGAAKTLLDLAGACMRLRQRARGIEAERQIGEETLVGAKEVKLSRLLARDLAHDAQDDVALRRVVQHGRAHVCTPVTRPARLPPSAWKN